MRLKPLLIAFLSLSFFAIDAKAQIKIGTNPTTIESTSNLEVEASTAGRKFKVDKATGKVTIADGTQGNHEVLISDANGAASWAKVDVQNIEKLPRAIFGGAQTNALTDGERVNVNFPNLAYAINGWTNNGSGWYAMVEGTYLVEASFEIENSEECTGSSVMGLEISLIINGNLIPSPSLNERLTPVYQDKYVTRITQTVGVLGNTQVSYSILPKIKNPQQGCVTKVVSGGLALTYLP